MSNLEKATFFQRAQLGVCVFSRLRLVSSFYAEAMIWSGNVCAKTWTTNNSKNTRVLFVQNDSNYTMVHVGVSGFLTSWPLVIWSISLQYGFTCFGFPDRTNTMPAQKKSNNTTRMFVFSRFSSLKGQKKHSQKKIKNVRQVPTNVFIVFCWHDYPNFRICKWYKRFRVITLQYYVGNSHH